MAYTVIDSKSAHLDGLQNTSASPLIIHARPGCQPVLDLDAFLATIPDRDFEPGEFEAFENAMAENRAMRRAIPQE